MIGSRKGARLLLSTRNPDKLREIERLVSGLSVELVTAADWDVPEVDETGATLADNAALKACAGFRATGFPCLGDDTGLCVTALGGAPGVHSARFAGPNATYEENRSLLLERLGDLPEAERTAEFMTCLALVIPLSLCPDPGRGDRVTREDGTVGELRRVEGRVRGMILRSPRGSSRFGYDPIFWVPAVGKTFAEMSGDEKNSMSHRGLAYRALQEPLVRVFGPGEIKGHRAKGIGHRA